MAILADYAITPDVFDVTSYSSEEVCRLHLREIGSVMRTEGLVRDLHDGAWRALFADDGRPWHRRGKELVKKLATQGRLISSPRELPAVPVDDRAWCEEALRTHSRRPLTGGIIATGPIKDEYRSESRVARIDRLDGADWWRNRSPSIRLQRRAQDYRRHLSLILRCANSIQFIDPHLDPTIDRYRHVADLLVDAGKRTPAPHIEIHRVCYVGAGRDRSILSVDQIESEFHQALARVLKSVDLQAEVFVWDHFHDRYLISNLVGILLPNGFDTSKDTDVTTWTRLGPCERDGVQREFDDASGRHHLHGKFSIPT